MSQRWVHQGLSTMNLTRVMQVVPQFGEGSTGPWRQVATVTPGTQRKHLTVTFDDGSTQQYQQRHRFHARYPKENA